MISQLNHSPFPLPVSGPTKNSSGKSIPTLLAVRRTLSSSSIFMPGLYLSSNVAYMRWALTYCRNCSACSSGVAESEAIVLRMRFWRGDRDLSDNGREGSSRRKDRYIDRNFIGEAIMILWWFLVLALRKLLTSFCDALRKDEALQTVRFYRLGMSASSRPKNNFSTSLHVVHPLPIHCLQARCNRPLHLESSWVYSCHAATMEPFFERR
jgi:hypothetical protein